LIGFAGAHCDASVFLELPKEILDQVTPLVGILVEVRREATVRFRRNDRDNLAVDQSRSEPVRVECPVGQKMIGEKGLDQVGHPSQVMSLSRQQPEIDRVSEGVRQRQDLGRDAAARAPYGLALSPPLAPWPERWTLTMEPSIIAYSKSASDANALNMR
jgi:hypothetical protein